MSDLVYAYNLGLADDFKQGKLSKDLYYRKLMANKGLQANLKSLNTQVSLTKAYNNSTIRNIDSYILVLESVALSLLRRNVQAYNKKLSKLNGYGRYLNDIRRLVYKDQNTERGFIGTLLYYQGMEGFNLSILDSIEKCLINFWNHLDINPYSKPRERWLDILQKLELPRSIDEFYDLEIYIKDLCLSNDIVNRKLQSLLLDFDDIKNLQIMILLLEISTPLYIFLEWLNTNNYLEFDIVKTKNTLINFNPVGGLNVVLVSFIVEGLVQTARDLSYLDIQTRMLDLNSFTKLDDYTNVCIQISKYLALGYDACSLLKFSFDDIELLQEAIFNDLKLFIKEDIQEKGDYRLDG